MGLDTVELILATEELFEIEIPDEVAAKLFTVGSLHEYIYAETRRRGRRLFAYEQIFIELRDLIAEHTGIDPEKIKPESRFIDDLRMD